MSQLFSDVTIKEMKPEGQSAASFTIQTNHYGKTYLISNCHVLKNPMFIDEPTVYWGQHEYTGDDGLSHCIKAFVLKYRTQIGDICDLLLCD